MENVIKKITFVGGKGGVGKSSTAAALAWKAARDGEKTLLISTDPAHNLGDLFERTIGGQVTQLMDNLFALEIDPERETEIYIQQVKENIKETVHATMMEEVNRQLDTAKASPGADEAALFDKLVSVILEERCHFDKLIFDTAPTGHTIRLLSLPELMGIWIERLLKKRQKTNESYSRLLHDGEPIEDPIYDVLQWRQERFSNVRDILLNEAMTSFIFVLNPERLSIVETEKSLHLLKKYDIYVKTLIVNKVLPDQDTSKFFTERKKIEQNYLRMIAKKFQEQHVLYVPFFLHDITRQEHLLKIANCLRKG